MPKSFLNLFFWLFCVVSFSIIRRLKNQFKDTFLRLKRISLGESLEKVFNIILIFRNWFPRYFSSWNLWRVIKTTLELCTDELCFQGRVNWESDQVSISEYSKLVTYRIPLKTFLIHFYFQALQNCFFFKILSPNPLFTRQCPPKTPLLSIIN